jgi:glyoxylase-like metal-dependent hydrolase (beta-lactamase superfamily II)
MFQCGTHRTQLQMIKLNTGLGEPYEIPVPWYVITHPEGNVVIDGGNAPQAAVDPVGHWGTAITDFYWPEMTLEQTVLPQLETIGVTPESVRWIVQSHLHIDHTGAVAVFDQLPNAQVLATRRELEYAHHPDWFTKKSYVASEWNDPRIDWVLLEDHEDGYDVFGDGVLRCWHSPGHSPGHQSFTVKLPESGSFLLAGDAAYTLDHWNEKVLPGIMTSAIEVARSVRRLHRIAEREHATVIAGHDPEGWLAFEQAPAFYA